MKALQVFLTDMKHKVELMLRWVEVGLGSLGSECILGGNQSGVPVSGPELDFLGVKRPFVGQTKWRAY